MSETRRLARSLVEAEPLTMDSRHSRAESIERLRTAAHAFRATLQGDRVEIAADDAAFVGHWEGGAGDLRLVGELRPPRRNRITLAILSMTLFAILVAAVAAWFSGRTHERWLMPIIAVLATLFMPYFVIGMASHGESDRARIRKALRVALADEEEGFPPARKWDDEE